MGLAIKLDTNGSNPDMLTRLLHDGLLDYVAMDIKNPLDAYDALSGGVADTVAIRRSIQLLLDASIDYEFRTTVVGGYHTVASVERIAESIAGARLYRLQNFESVATLDPDFGGRPVPREILERMRDIAKEYVGSVIVSAM